MTVVLLVFLGGVLTILSPCILPVLPFVFARSEQRFLTNGLPLLAGMAVTFAGIATLAAVGGAWAVRVNQYGRLFALLLLSAFAATLLSRRLADWLTRPLVAAGDRLLRTASGGTRESRTRALGAARSCDRLVVGALRRSDSGVGAHRRRDFGTEHPHHAAAVRLRGGRGDFAGGGDPRGRASVRRHEEIPGRGRMDTACAGRRRVAGGARDRLWLGQQHSHPLVAGRNQSAGAVAHRRHRSGRLTPARMP